MIREVDHATGLISTVAGTAAGLVPPQGVAVDAAGDIFVAGGGVIREFNHSTGLLTTVAGAGPRGYGGDGGPAAGAQLFFPADVAVDAAGDLFIADTCNNVIREIDASTGLISTVAGNARLGDGGPAGNARLAFPAGVAVDAAGDIFIADMNNCLVREVNHATGLISTVAGSGVYGYSGDGGAATAATLNWPQGIAVDAAGDIIIADTFNNVIRELSGNLIVPAVSIAASASSSVCGQDLTFTATVSATIAGGATPSGSVEFFAGTTYLGSGELNAAGEATLTTSTLAAGDYDIMALYPGDSTSLSGVSLALRVVVTS